MLLGNKTFRWQPAPLSSLAHSHLTALVLGYVIGSKLESLLLSIPEKIMVTKHYFLLVQILAENFIVE